MNLYNFLIRFGYIPAIISSTNWTCPVRHSRCLAWWASWKWSRFYRIMSVSTAFSFTRVFLFG